MKDAVLVADDEGRLHLVDGPGLEKQLQRLQGTTGHRGAPRAALPACAPLNEVDIAELGFDERVSQRGRSKKESAGMIVIPIVGVVAGVILGLGCRVFVLVPVILLVAAIAIASGVLSGFDPLTLALGTMLAVASPQIGYLSAVGVKYAAGTCFWRRAVKSKPALLRAAQAGIGRELRVIFEPPQQLPQEMVTLLAKMKGGLSRRPLA